MPRGSRCIRPRLGDLREQGVLVLRNGKTRPRRGAPPRRRHGRRVVRCTACRRSCRSLCVARQQQECRGTTHGNDGRCPTHRGGQLRRTRAHRVPRGGGSCAPTRAAAHHSRCVRPHARVHLDGSRRLEVRFQPRQRRCTARGRHRCGVDEDAFRRHPLPHRLERVRGRELHARSSTDGRSRQRTRRRGGDVRRWSRCRA